MSTRPQPFTARRTAERRSHRFAVAGAITVIVGCSGLLGRVSDMTLTVIGVATLGAWIFALLRVRPQPFFGWLMAGGALVLFEMGGLARVEMHTLGNLTSSRALLPDLLSLPGYMMLAVGLTLLASKASTARRVDLDVLLDAATCALGALSLVWVFLIGPALFALHTAMHVRVILALYPTLSVFLTAVMARLVFTLPEGRLSGCHRFMLAAVSVLLCGDVLYTLADTRLISVGGSWLDLPYGLAFVAAGAAILHPSSAQPSVGDGALAESKTTRGRLTLIATALSLPAVLLATRPLTGNRDTVVVSAIVIALTVCTIVRVIRALHSSQAARDELVHQATHDHLTGLPNRVVARAYLAERLHDPVGGLATLFVDLDRFKLVNDTFGHSHGDQLLVAVAARLRTRLQSKDLVARIGGDEFVVVATGLGDLEDATAIADRICQALREPFSVNGNELTPLGSVGVSYTDAHGMATAETLMRDADTAMYEAKALGGDAFAVFDTEVRARVSERLRLERDLRRALDRQELAVHYQPVVDLTRGVVSGFEALLRWEHPLDGNISPARFIPIAEESGLIVPIGTWVLQQACADLARWRKADVTWSDLTVAVNVSARQVQAGSLLSVIKAELMHVGLPASALNVELTESLLMEEESGVEDLLAELRSLGVRVSIDDFGTGYSSLAYLKRYPVDRVKIDKAFIDGLARDDTSEETLVSAIVAMSRALGLETVAEGIELPSQRDRLIDLGCDAGQGWLWSPAIPASAVPPLLSGPIDAYTTVELTTS